MTAGRGLQAKISIHYTHGKTTEEEERVCVEYSLPISQPVLATALLFAVESEGMESHGCMVIGKHFQVEVIEFKHHGKLAMNL